MTNKIILKFSFLMVFTLLIAFSRIIPHTPNFPSLRAIWLFGAANFDKIWKVFLIPIGATWLIDFFINNVLYARYYTKFTWFYECFYWQYGGYLLITLAGLAIFNKTNTTKVLIGTLACTAILFFISNFDGWIGSVYYPQNLGGLMTSYAAVIAYLNGSLQSDLFYASILFASYYALESNVPFYKLTNVKYA